MESSYGLSIGGQFASGGGPDRMWEDLVLAAECHDRTASAREIAERVNRADSNAVFTLPVSRATYGIVSEGAADPATHATVLARLSEFIVLVKPALLASALRSETDAGTRQSFLREAARVLTVPALTRATLAASAAWERPLSPPLRELLKKLSTAATATTQDGAAAETVLRETVAHRIELVPPDSVNPVTRGDTPVNPARRVKRVPGRVTPEADRIIYMALETGATGELLWIAIGEMAEQGRFRELLEAIKRAPDSAAASAITRRVATPAALTAVLDEDPIDLELLDILLRPMGIAAAKPLLAALAESRSRATRRAVLDRLATLGPDIAALVEARLRDSRWFVVRNMLMVLREADCKVASRTVNRFVHHTDARVRREAILLLLRNAESADEALLAGLKDADKGVLRAALQAARTRMPEVAVPVLAQRVVEDMEFPPEFRVMALHVLGRTSSTLALDALLVFVQGGKSLIGRPRLAHKSPEMLAALSGLARSWSHDRRARALIDAAARNRDPQIAAAVRPVGEQTA